MKFSKQIIMAAVAIAATWTLTSTPSFAAEKSLYERLGGQGATQAVVTKFISNVGGDKRINGYFATADLKKLIEKTQFAISTEETRHYLNGIFVHTTDVGGHAMLRAVAMNGSFLRASLFTSVVAFGVAAMAIGIGIVFILIGVLLFLALGSFAEAGLVFACVPLALIGGALGCLLALPFNGITSAAGGSNFAEVSFAFRVTGDAPCGSRRRCCARTSCMEDSA